MLDPLADILHTRAQNIFNDDYVTNNIIPSTPSISHSDDTIPIASTTSYNDDDLTPEYTLPLVETTPVSLPPTSAEHTCDVTIIKRKIYTIKDELDSLLRMLNDTPPASQPLQAHTNHQTIPHTSTPQVSSADQIVEGVFNGEKMVGQNGREYNVPPNYASKSKIVEGDMMKLTITPEGRFIYKQIGPIPRKRIIGILQFDEETQLWTVYAHNTTYKVLTASATFYRGKPGDEVIILIAENIPNTWGAVDNIIRK